MRFITLIFLILWSAHASGQIAYSYTDPCTGAKKTIQVPSNGVTVTYYGQIQTFQPADFYSGAFENWAQGVFSSFGSNNPCASVVGVPTAVTVAQNSAINFLGTINSLSALSDMASIGGSSNMLGGTVQSTQNSTSNNKKDSKSNGSQSSGSTSTGSGTTQGSSTGTQAGGSTANSSGQGSGSGTSGSPQSTGGQGSGGSGSSSTGGQGSGGSGSSESQGTPSQTSGSGSGQGSGSSGTPSSGSTTGSGSGSGTSQGSEGAPDQSTQTAPQSEEGGKTNLVGSSVGSVQNSTSSNSNPTNKNGGGKPTMLASSDFVGFQFQNSDVATGGKFTGGFASMRWDGARSWGINMDYTTALRGPNITGYYAFMRPKRIDLISVTGTIGFEEKITAYGTLSVGQMWTINKLNKMKAVYMLTASWGRVYGSPFIGTAAIAGGMYDFRITKRFDVKVLMLYVYAPYVSYYNDILLKSPHVVLPIVGTNINITKRFKLNVNCGGAWAIKESALNYTIMFGTRMLL